MAFRVASFPVLAREMSRPAIQHLTLGDSSFSQIASAMLLFSSVTDEDELDHASLFTSVKS